MFLTLSKDKPSGYICHIHAEDRDELHVIHEFFQKRKIYITSPNMTQVKIPESRIFEFELWFHREDYSYEFTDDIPTVEPYPKETEYFRREVFDPSCVSKRQLKQYQLDAMNWAVKRSRTLLADDPGLGKSLESLSIFCHFYKQGKVDSLVLIVKKHLPYQWKHEILSSTDLFTEDDILIVTNANKHRCFDDQSKKIIIIQNHIWADAVLSYRKGSIPKKKSSLRWDKPYFDLLKVWGKKSSYLIIDESHEYKNPESVKFMSLVPYLPCFKFRTLLTATPSTNSFVDWWSQLYIVDRGIIGLDYYPFILLLAEEIGTKYDVYDITRYKENSLIEYKEKFKLNVIKRRKQDIPEIKTKRIIKSVFFELSSQHNQIYEIIREEELKRIHNDDSGVRVKDVKNKFAYSLMCLDNPFLLKDKLISETNIFNESVQKNLNKWKSEYDSKILYIDDYLKEAIEEQNEKVIIFDSHPLSMDIMYERYKKYDPIIIHGQTKENDEGRQKLIDRFNDRSDTCKLAILSIHVASAGYNLNRGGRRILYYSLPYDGILFRQSLDRTDRANSEDDSLIEVLLYGDTLDEFRYNVVDARVEFNDTFLNQSLNEYQIYNLLKRGKI